MSHNVGACAMVTELRGTPFPAKVGMELELMWVRGQEKKAKLYVALSTLA